MMLRGKHVKAVEVARETLAVADALGDGRLRCRALNTLGTSRMALGEVDEGAADLREALALAERENFPSEQNVAWVNLADALHLAGRLREARAAVEEGLARELRPSYVWLVVLRGELAIEAGEWDEAEAILGSIGGRQIGNTLVNLDLRRAQLALGRGDHARARGALDEAARLARVSAAGMTVEADAAQRARPRRARGRAWRARSSRYASRARGGRRRQRRSARAGVAAERTRRAHAREQRGRAACLLGCCRGVDFARAPVPGGRDALP